jgi:negative regulator of sigma-B (phosphoserine phosphatase)
VTPFVEWCVRGRALAGQSVSGDAHVFEEQRDGAARRVLVAVVDGLGHGGDAARASSAAAAALRGFPGDVAAAFAACDAALAGTRGAAMTLATLDEGGALSWAGIGNVEGFVLQARTSPIERAREHLTLRGGVVGARATPARVSSLQLARGDVLVMASDGIASGAAGAIAREAPVAVIADDLLARFAKASDDALALVLRYLGDLGGSRRDV